MYFHDTDFCFRARKIGFKIVLLYSTLLEHSEGDHTFKHGTNWWYMEPWKLFYVSRNAILMLKKHFSLLSVVYSFELLFLNLASGDDIFQSLYQSIKGWLEGLRIKP